MDLPDCPPGAEGYEDSVVEMPKKPSLEEGECTKAEQEFQDHLNSLKIKVENAGARCMVERRGRDVSGKWIYLCYPCAAVCSGESILQTHISGKKHKAKLSLKNVWPQSIFDEHPYVLSEKGIVKEKGKDAPTEKVLQKMAEEVNFHNKSSELDQKYDKYRSVRCHIQDSLDALKAPLVGLEYLVEHPPEQAHYEPSYMCTLCHKQGHPRTIINHMTCFWHRYNYLTRHFTKATMLISPYRSQHMYREGVNLIINRLAQRIEDKYGRLKPVNFDKEMYEKERELIHQWICKGYHFSEKDGPTFEEVVDTGLIESLHKSNGGDGKRLDRNKKDPSPPVVAAPTKPLFNSYTRPAGRQERRASADALSDISDEPEPRRREVLVVRPHGAAQRFDPYRMRQDSPAHRYTNKGKTAAEKNQEKQKPPNYDYKQKLAAEQRQHAEDAAKKTLAYHEKNPEKHPLYPEEWKKFWNRRYKEIQAEGKDPSKHDFKPEWIVYWTARMKALHEEELRVVISEIYRKICLPVPDQGSDEKPPEPIRKSVERRRSPDPRRRSPDPRRRTPEPWRRSPDSRRRSPDPRRRSPMRRRSPDLRRRSPVPRRRTPDRRRSPGFDRYRMRKEDDRHRRDYRSPPRSYGESRHELHRSDRHRSRSPVHSRTRSPARTHFEIESVRRSRSPLSRRDEAAPLRNRSPARVADLAPSLQTVLISDDELRPEEDISPWNSDNEDSLGSLPEARSPAPQSRAGSEMSRASRSRREFAPHARPAAPADLGPPENVVATLRLLVALEDYLGSLGPKVVDLLTDALRMEKEKANSSEELLEREAAVALLETAKEKLKGAVQAGLVPAAAAPAVRAAVVRVAATLHEADTRAQRPAQKSNNNQKAATSRSSGASASAGGACGAGGAGAGVPVAGVGEVDRAQIAQQMAAALVAQGKTDVSSEELAQLVDAVVGMAEAKKREAEVKKKVEARAAERASRSAPPEPAQGKTASALQMLQSAYDENEKRIEKEDAPDAMDGLSDSDLETLLKNFNELSAEEQHSLIAYLKKLEAREPQRVEKLRQYVSAAADAPPPPLPLPTVTVESDDDDYAVEEVFQSATQKVKEDQIRQEMEIVKKSLEESTKVVPPPAETSRAPSAEAARGTSSATDLLALVQASLQPAPAPPAPPAGVVPSLTQPRSFGDRPDPPPDAPPPPDHAPPAWSQRPPPDAREPVLQEIPAQDARGPFDQDARGPFNSDNRGPFNQDGRAPFSPEARVPFNQDRGQFNLAPGGQFNQDSRVPFTPDVRTQFNQDNRGPPPFSDNRGGFNQGIPRPYTQDNRVPFNQDGRGTFNINVRGPLLQNNAGSAMQNNRGFPMQNNRGPPAPERGGFMPQDNRGPVFNNFGQDNMNRGSNFVDTRIQDMRPEQSQQQYGNFEQQHFRGRGGRGNFGGHMRGRGRGFY